MEQGNIQNTNKSYKGTYINNLANTALVLGLISMFLVTTIFIPLLLGSFGIILAVLSKGKNLKMHPVAKTGFTTSILAILIAIFTTGYSMYMLQTNAEYRAMINETCETLYGMPLDEYLQTYGGSSNFLLPLEEK